MVQGGAVVFAAAHLLGQIKVAQPQVLCLPTQQAQQHAHQQAAGKYGPGLAGPSGLAPARLGMRAQYPLRTGPPRSGLYRVATELLRRAPDTELSRRRS